MAQTKRSLERAEREIPDFQAFVLKYYRRNGRHELPWRITRDPYRILVSEFMLQQTQVARVIPKYREFIRKFPSARSLARTPLAEVLRAWHGLGYNRRALFLKRTAERIVREYGGKLPRDVNILNTLPGIGPNTAGAIVAFAFNKPAVFIETNIRRAFIHYFFPRRRSVHDAELLPLVQRSLIGQEPRAWYSALMDHGAHLGEILPKSKNPNRRSKQYAKQTQFTGSVRELRGKILRILLAQGVMTEQAIAAALGDRRTPSVLTTLVRESIVLKRGARYRIAH
jgi:A/G-specific adenine glycosylase